MKALVPLFRGASQLEVTAALRHFKPARVDMNIPLMEEGDQDPSLIVVLEGELEVRCGPVEIATARTGDLVGEVSLFTGSNRTASVRTLTPCKLLTLGRDGYDSLVEARNTVAYSLELDTLGQLARRLRRLTGLLARLENDVKTLRPTGTTSDTPRLFSTQRSLSHVDMDITDQLARSPLFHEASAATLDDISAGFSTQKLADKSIVIEAGRDPGGLVFPIQGTVAGFHPRGSSMETLAADAAPGTFLDVTAMFDHKPSPVTWRARGEVQVAVMRRPEWKVLIESTNHTGSAFRYAAILSLIDRLNPLTDRVLTVERQRRDQVRGEIADLLGKESNDLPESQFSHYGFSGQRSG